MKVLVGAGTGNVRRQLGNILRKVGYDCIFVENARVVDRAYELLPDVIILDTRHARTGSLEVLKALKSAVSLRDIPVILSSPRRTPANLAEGYRLGAFDYIFQPYLSEEILSKIEHITHTSERVKELENRLNRDYLTGLYNRRFFMDRFREELDWVSRYKEPLSLLLLDIDHFKKVNDQYGHICGDEILRQVAQKVLSVVGLEATAGRFGGEEFIVLLPNVPMEEAMAMAERLRAEIQNNLFDCSCNDTSVNLTVTVSLGVTTCNSADGLTLDQMIAQTDDALYAAKEGGRNRVVAHRVSEPMISAV